MLKTLLLLSAITLSTASSYATCLVTTNSTGTTSVEVAFDFNQSDQSAPLAATFLAADMGGDLLEKNPWAQVFFQNAEETISMHHNVPVTFSDIMTLSSTASSSLYVQQTLDQKEICFLRGDTVKNFYETLFNYGSSVSGVSIKQGIDPYDREIETIEVSQWLKCQSLVVATGREDHFCTILKGSN